MDIFIATFSVSRAVPLTRERKKEREREERKKGREGGRKEGRKERERERSRSVGSDSLQPHGL